MLDWYITHVYVLPWWAYALALYPCGFAATFHLFEDPGDGVPLGVFWPIVVFIALPLMYGGWSFAWLVGLTDEPPFSLSLSESGHTQ